ncbi:tripartite motif-containing protein 66 isoform X2 [Mangifera indica]|uniref:tripartite motif-containing protein 66 isoform X2 n=1 Tax=Mangifera indica TaxID=29780 RepID=UPI001CF997B3|nr:tripartite motif-containing protein 66 isoform X2 [Mangifera indica]
MGKEEEKEASPAPPPPPVPPPPPPFDPSRMIGIIKRKALIKELAALYHAECLAYCQQLLELQKRWEEPFVDTKTPDDLRKETAKPPKRRKKTR